MEILWSASRTRKAEIRQRDDGLYQVDLSRKYFEKGPYGAYTYWASTNRAAILTDTAERARALAEEELRLLGDAPDEEPAQAAEPSHPSGQLAK